MLLHIRLWENREEEELNNIIYTYIASVFDHESEFIIIVASTNHPSLAPLPAEVDLKLPKCKIGFFSSFISFFSDLKLLIKESLIGTLLETCDPKKDLAPWYSDNHLSRNGQKNSSGLLV